MPVSAKGRVEHQKQNQTATSQWPVGFVFGVQLDYSCRLKSVSSDAEKVVRHNSLEITYPIHTLIKNNLSRTKQFFKQKWFGVINSIPESIVRFL